MAVRKRFLVMALLALAGWYSIDWIEARVELATLHTRGESQDHYTRVFVVDDPESDAVWVRAERQDRLWLDALRLNPEVVLHRGGVDLLFTAESWSGRGGHERVDRLFRAKYGVFDQLSALVWRRDAVPVRLERRYPPTPY